MKHNIHGCRFNRPATSYCFSHASLDSVALNRASKDSSYSETNSHCGQLPFRCRPPQEENRHVSSEGAPAELINPLKVGVP
jgi:hypothetical protein